MDRSKLPIVQRCVKAIESVFGISAEDLFSRSREWDLIRYKHMFRHHLRERGMTVVGVGELCEIDHATVIHSSKQVKNWLDVDKGFRHDYIAYKKAVDESE